MDAHPAVQLITTGAATRPRVVRNEISSNYLGMRVSEHSKPSIGGSVATANRIFGNAAGAIKNTSLSERGGLRTLKPATMSVPYNFWGSDCPDSSMFRGEPVEFRPWVDESGTRSLDKCEEAAPE